MKRRTRKQWKQYHLDKARRDACGVVDHEYSHHVGVALNSLSVARRSLEVARRHEPWLSRLLFFVGIKTQYHSQYIDPLVSAAFQAEQHLNSIKEQRAGASQEAAELAARQYLAKNLQRKQMIAEAQERAKARRAEARIRYLEISPAKRVAARALRALFLKLHKGPDGLYECHYCNRRVPAEATHLDHKRPLAKRGSNRRTNLVLACASCNLRKGKKAYEVYVEQVRAPR